MFVNILTNEFNKSRHLAWALEVCNRYITPYEALCEETLMTINEQVVFKFYDDLTY
jgi:hypothetical protein